MRNGSPRLRLPLKLLALAAGLMLISLVAMQCLPLFRSRGVETTSAKDSTESLASTVLPQTESMPIVEELTADASSILSGSAAGDQPHSPPARSDRKPSTIDVRLRPADDDFVPLPPPVAIDDEQSDQEIRQLQERIDELERDAAEWKRDMIASLPESQRVNAAIQQQFQDHQAELRSVSQQVAILEERLRMMQEDLKAAESTRQAPRGEGQPAARISIRTQTEKGKSQVQLDARDASLPELLARLGEVSGVNLLVSPEVTGTASLHLKAANGAEVLDTVCRAHHCRQERTGNIVVISRKPVSEKAAKAAVPEMMTKLYRLQHLSGPEIRPYVHALLTPGLGTVSFSTIRERVGRTEYRDPPRAILVKDTAQVISEVDRLILELDRPPTKGKALRPLSQTRMEQLLQAATPLPTDGRPQTAPAPKSAAVPPPPSEAWPSRRPEPRPEPALAPVLELPSGSALLPTGTDLPGPCLDCDVFEPPLVREETKQQ